MSFRIENIYLKLEQNRLDGLILSHPANISYLTAYTSRDSYLLVSRRENRYFTDSRYIEEAKKNLKQIAVIQKFNGSVFQLIADNINKLRLKRVGFEERYLAFGEHKKISAGLNKGVQFLPTHSLVEELRQLKSKDELKKIEKACQITVEALKFIEKVISPGKKEIEISAELERFIRYQGATSSAFNIIVASGPNSSFPHHITGARQIKNNEPVLVDIGVDYLGYKSDLTRVFFSGKITPLFKRIYDIVLAAQKRAVTTIKPGVLISRLDKSARQYITQRGYGRFFGHGLGHGIGLEVHEAPHISSKNNHKLAAGMVFTVEPAIYLPGKFGVRLEDMALVAEGGVKVLSGSLNYST